ncbi:MAG: hypothetical protein CSB33_01610 [Desulfobacterales bacterium]|nr:MAG: hypothetical protein CSB33_01610 [Desulfobacterales bacterium]
MAFTAFRQCVPASQRKRFRRVRRFFLGCVWHFFFWDILLDRPFLHRFRPPLPPRQIQAARKLRRLALEMGGVLIKLGQFLSIRADILPPEVTSELTNLQDEVPAESAADMIAVIESELGRPLGRIFRDFSRTPLAAASLAQVHRARLFSGETVVVKIQRPAIADIVSADLAAIAIAIRHLKKWKALSRRVDLDWLLREFSDITRRELDFEREARNVRELRERLGPEVRSKVCLPRIYPECSGGRVLTMEDVGFIKISDREALLAAGISPGDVADRLYHIYMRQVFETFFVHVDPHPGNLFVRPLPTPAEKAAGRALFLPGEAVPPTAAGREFHLVFVDFGMMAHTPRRLRAALREYVVAVGTRDAGGIVASYIKAGFLLPGADIPRITALHEELLRTFEGIRAGEFRETGIPRAKDFLFRYRELIREAPFQFQADMLFILRAVGILSGLATHLDLSFDIWEKSIPYAERYAGKALREEALGNLRELARFLPHLSLVPVRMHEMVSLALDGGLTIQTRPAADAPRPERLIAAALHSLAQVVAGAALCLSATGLYLHGAGLPAGALYAVSAILFFRGLRKLSPM